MDVQKVAAIIKKEYEQGWILKPISIAITYRMVISLWAILILRLYPISYKDWMKPIIDLYERLSAHSSFMAPFIQDWVIWPWYRWDAEWYLRIAADGYVKQGSTAFAPLYPALIRILGSLLNGNLLLSALVISNLALALSCVFIFREAREHINDLVATHSVLYFLIFPTAFFLAGIYSEPLFILLILLAWYFARHNQWHWVFLFAALATLTRFQGIGLIAPLIYLWWRSPKPRQRWGLALIFIPFVPFIWGGYLGYVLHREFPWDALAREWHQQWAWPWSGILSNLRAILVINTYNIDTWLPITLDLVLTLLTITLILVGIKYLQFEYTLLTLALILPALMKVDLSGPMVSMSRYLVVLWPIFLVLGIVGQKKFYHWLYVSIAILLQAICSTLFFLWYWVG